MYLLPTHTHTQWKAAPKSKLMDSKLRCVFVEGEPREAAPVEEAPADSTETQVSDRLMWLCQFGWFSLYF